MRLGFAVLLSILVIATPSVAHAKIEGYASYQQPKRCHPAPHAGTAYVARWLVRQHGGSVVSTSRPCRKKDGPTSEHQTGRAVDWAADATRRPDRRRVSAFLHHLFAKNGAGQQAAKARRMGVMYVIWNDRIYPAWDKFRPSPYLSSSCKKRKKCSQTLRHRDHVHISLSKAGAKGRTSWYDGRL